ncbi:MAG: hypothetical protein H0U95_16420 [Bacteroidetes bacterium]|nr:hypothetical protein [Bacteroidota bacterium]
MKHVLPIIISLFLFRCAQQSSPISDSGKEKTPFFKIIYFDNYYTDFLKALKADRSDWDKIYFEKIKNGLIKEYFSKSEYYPLVRETFSYPIQDTNGLTKFIADLNENRIDIEKIISEAFTLCNKQIKNDSVTFYMIPLSSDIKEIVNKMGGVTAQTAGSKQIILTIDFSVNSWKEMLKYTVAHEFNHSYWTNINFSNNYKMTLLSYIIFEGKADSFAHSLYPNVKAPWTTSLNASEKTALWKKIMLKLQSDDQYLLASVMFGSEDYPIWGGYTLGYDIMQTAFKKNPELLKTNWTNLDADKLLELSDYK